MSDDALDERWRHGADVGAVGEVGVGHDGGRVGVDEHHLVPLLDERLACLRAGVVELASLADDDRPGAENHYLLDAGELATLGRLRGEVADSDGGVLGGAVGGGAGGEASAGGAVVVAAREGQEGAGEHCLAVGMGRAWTELGVGGEGGRHGGGGGGGA